MISISQGRESFRLKCTSKKLFSENVLGDFMVNISWHDYLLMVSFIAAIAGIVLLKSDRGSAKDDLEEADHMLILMSFAYWLVYCGAFALQKVISTDWETVVLSIKLTGVIAYLLTASCILSLPLNRISVRQPE
jgi:hypothetical protein